MRFICNVMKENACLAWVSVDNKDGESPEATAARATLSLTQNYMRSKSQVDDEEAESIAAISSKYAAIAADGCRTRRASRWTIQARNGHATIFEGKLYNYGVGKLPMTGHIIVHDDAWIANTEKIVSEIMRPQ